MPETMFEAVRAFHEATGLEVRDTPIDMKELHPRGTSSSTPLWRLRVNLVAEEHEEFVEAMNDGEDLVPIADAICDLIYVLCGTAVSFGIPLDECFAEVQRSNMSKIGPEGKVNRREDGKILKHKDFSPPDLRRVIYGAS